MNTGETGDYDIIITEIEVQLILESLPLLSMDK